jgi:TetR/AcrR family transcriptional regulator, cholesterol catabolism regulator
MTRQEILIAAAQIFSEKGYHATSMQDIARAVNLKKASLYHHVESKQEILLALLDQALDLVIAEIETVSAQPIPAADKLKLAMRTYLQILAEQRELSAVLLFEHRSLKPEFHDRHLPRRDRFEQIWRSLIQAGIDEGAFDCVEVPIAARALLGIMGWMITWYRPDGSLSAAEISDQYAELVLNGLVVRN